MKTETDGRRAARRGGRRPGPPRTVVNILQAKDGRRKHMYSFVLACDPGEVHRLIYERLGAQIVR